MAPASAHGRAGNKFIEKYGMAEHAKWHLGQDDEESERACGKVGHAVRVFRRGSQQGAARSR
jgi:hypothetical protein